MDRKTVGRHLEQAGELDPAMVAVTDDVALTVGQRVQARPATKKLTTALRMFLRYWAAECRCVGGLEGAIPVVAHWRLSSLPRHLSDQDVERLIASCDTASPVGRRDRAILLLLARLGLRAGDIVQMQLHDIDWKGAWIHVSGNQRAPVVQTNKTWGIDTLMTIPMTGWLANVATSTDTTYSSLLGQDLSFCNYPQLADGGLVSSSTCCQAIGTQESTLVDGGSNHLDTSFMGNWVTHLVSTFGPAANGGVKYYQLDNEPDNWQGLRQDIYPALYPPGTNCMDYAVAIASGNEAGVSPNEDIMDRSVAYATAIKTADPTAQVLFLSVMNPNDTINLMQTECGIGSWGSATVPYSATNSYAMAMLAKGKQYEATNHQRIFDCLDTHYPGAAQSMWTSSNTFSSFQGWINSSYPGTGICVSEYNVANDTSDPTATSQEADYLGTFGLMGIRLAAYWTTLVHTDSTSNSVVHNYTYNAFAMFRNYDGAGSTFGNVSVGAASSYSGVHAYAATDSATSPSKLWIMLVNVGTSAQSNMTISINNFTSAATALVYQSNNGAAPSAAASATISGGKISSMSIAANTVALITVTR